MCRNDLFYFIFYFIYVLTMCKGEEKRARAWLLVIVSFMIIKKKKRGQVQVKLFWDKWIRDEIIFFNQSEGMGEKDGDWGRSYLRQKA